MEDLTQYEIERDARVARNKQRIAALGIHEAVAALKTAIDAEQPKQQPRKQRQPRVFTKSTIKLRSRVPSIKPASYFEAGLSPPRKTRSNQRVKRLPLRQPPIKHSIVMSDTEQWKELLSKVSVLSDSAEKLASVLVDNAYILSAVQAGEINADDVVADLSDLIDGDPDLKDSMKGGHRGALERAIRSINKPLMSPGDASNNNGPR